MAQLAMGIAGAAVGFAIGGPAGAQWGFAIGTAAGGAMFPPKMPDGPKLNDRQVQSSAYGETIPRIYGSYVVAGNIIWATDLKETANTQGGKGGPEYTTYSYSASFAVSLCQGPIVGVRRIWADGKLIWDAREEGESALVRQNFEGSLVTHYGTETQEPDATIQAFEGDTPAYRGEAYVVFIDMQLSKFGNRIPLMRFEVVTDGEQAYSAPTLIFNLNESIGFDPRTNGGYQQKDPETDRLFLGQPLSDDGYNHCVFDPASRTILHAFPEPTELGAGNYRQHRQGIFVESRREYWIMSMQLTPRLIWWHVYDADTYALIKTFSRSTSGAATINFGLWMWRWNSIAENVIVWRTAVGSAWVITDSTNLFLNDVPATVNSIAYDMHFFNSFYGSYLVVTSYAGSGDRIGIFNALTYSFVRSYDMADYYLEPQTQSFWQNEEDTNICHDTKRNRWFAISRFGVNASLFRRHYAIFNGETGELETVGLITLDKIGSSVQYNSTNDQFLVYHAFSTSDSYTVIDAGTLTVIRSVEGDGLDNLRESSIYPGLYYAVAARGTTQNGFVVYRLSIGEIVSPDTVPLKDVVAAECAQVGLTAGDIDTTNLSGNVRGFLVSGAGSGRGALEALMNAYQFDAVESSGKLKFVSRGNAARTTINIDDIAVHDPGQEVPTPLPFARQDEVTLPQRLTIKYADLETEFLQGSQEAARYTTNSLNQIVIEVPVVMSPGEAKALAQSALYSSWAARTSTKFTTTRKYSAVEPTDIVTINNNAIRIGRKMLKGNMLEFEGTLDNASVYAQTPVAGTTSVPDSVISVLTRTNIIALDIPILRDIDDNSSFYIGANGYDGGTWPGTSIYKSTDGETFFEFQTLTTGTVIGAASNVLGQYDENTFDETNVVNISLVNRANELESKTELQVLNGSNACLIGNEILQFKNAVQQSDGSYNLSGLLRGRRSTVTSGHASGDRFVLLTTTSLLRPPPEDAELNLLRTYKAPTIGASVLTASVLQYTNTGIGRKPFAPVFLAGGRNTTGDLTINWIRCSRIGSEWRDFVDTSLGETTESYEIEILNAASPPAVVRTITTTTNTASYTRAQQETDFGSPAPSSITVRVYQISSTFGRGSPAEAVI
jgi:hypothetical protein